MLGGLKDLIRQSIGGVAELAMQVEPDLPPALVDPNQLELAILNLAINGRDAMPQGGLLRIRAHLGKTAASPPTSLSPGRYVCVLVEDTGTGMDPAPLARAAEPFFSTKGGAQSGGALVLASRPGEGTRAVLWLPLADAPADPANPALPSRVAQYAEVEQGVSR